MSLMFWVEACNAMLASSPQIESLDCRARTALSLKERREKQLQQERRELSLGFTLSAIGLKLGGLAVFKVLGLGTQVGRLC